jgi:hypothetical protein
MARRTDYWSAPRHWILGRTLGYLFVNGKNLSVLMLASRMAAETISVFGDNGLPAQAAACKAVAEAAGPTPFEAP